ncbi:Dabb family protein [Steroidobacter sp.]|uniref:Dabb family protein n=1 Tax=Steroidobacter sp. TaxID=1978227 RepID=UPI001A3E53B3|nr:Dabb family protein [Steroidobacter sp.]MBL8270827.1 Dabb family protein [Steroidobacter sp.]
MTTHSRREVIAAAAALAGAGVAGQAAAATQSCQPTPANKATLPPVVHHVFFWLKNPKSKEDLAKLLAGLHTLGGIESVKAIHIGVPANTEQRGVVDASYQASEILCFDDVAGQNAYQVHPIHRKFVADCEHLFERVVVYDATVVPPASKP